MRKSLVIAALVLAAALASTARGQAAIDAAPGVSGIGRLSKAANLVPAEQVEQGATQQYAQLKAQAREKGALLPLEHPQVQRLRAIALRILPHTVRWNERARAWKWEVNLFASKQVNAFCMPGGKIAFYTGILDNLKLTDDEVAAVMGHEISHALREHARAQAGKNELTQLGAGLVSRALGLGNVGNTVLGAGANLLSLKFSREDETEADLVGIDLAARAGYDPRAGLVLWQKMEAANSGGAPPELLSTHPRDDRRLGEMNRHMGEVLPLYAATRGIAVEKLPPYESNTGKPTP